MEHTSAAFGGLLVVVSVRSCSGTLLFPSQPSPMCLPVKQSGAAGTSGSYIAFVYSSCFVNAAHSSVYPAAVSHSVTCWSECPTVSLVMWAVSGIKLLEYE